jgi:hypothetical protein
LLYAVRDAIFLMGYDERTCQIMADGHPPARCGDVFVAVHQSTDRQTMDNAYNGYYNFSVTLTMRTADVPIDRVGDQRLARKLSRKTGFNAKVEIISNSLHMDWGVIQDANNYLMEFNQDAYIVHGFAEPQRYRGSEIPQLVGGEWFYGMPETQDVGLKAEMRFEDARRLQPIAEFV